MVSSSFRCKIASLVLAGALLVPLASAAAPGVRSERGAVESLLAQIWTAVRTVWSQVDLDNGCRIDPFGGCAEQQVEPETDNGCKIDPYGGCWTGN
jgi:hypothetical protein